MRQIAPFIVTHAYAGRLFAKMGRRVLRSRRGVPTQRTEAHLAEYFKYPSGAFERNVTRLQAAVRHVAFDSKGRNLAIAGDDGAKPAAKIAAAPLL